MGLLPLLLLITVVSAAAYFSIIRLVYAASAENVPEVMEDSDYADLRGGLTVVVVVAIVVAVVVPVVVAVAIVAVAVAVVVVVAVAVVVVAVAVDVVVAFVVVGGGINFLVF